jgi:hypothetical protein
MFRRRARRHWVERRDAYQNVSGQLEGIRSSRCHSDAGRIRAENSVKRELSFGHVTIKR